MGGGSWHVIHLRRCSTSCDARRIHHAKAGKRGGETKAKGTFSLFNVHDGLLTLIHGQSQVMRLIFPCFVLIINRIKSASMSNLPQNKKLCSVQGQVQPGRLVRRRWWGLAQMAVHQMEPQAGGYPSMPIKAVLTVFDL